VLVWLQIRVWVLIPLQNLGKLAGKSVQKVTGNLPGWVASDEQKKSLEKMMNGVQEQEMPDESELSKLHEEGGKAVADEGWMSGVKNMMPSMGGGGEKISEAAKSATTSMGGSEQTSESAKKVGDVLPGNASKEKDEGKDEQDTARKGGADGEDGGRKKPRKLNAKPDEKDNSTDKATSERKKPRKLNKEPVQGKAQPSNDTSGKDEQVAAVRRRAEKREGALKKMLQESGVSEKDIEEKLRQAENTEGAK
jgi:hypothetical protein